ncbi:MAG: glycerate kinase [Deltaproteobacteria bacterium]|nr:glycerate kinase [Deltaproteobacteria bacterium]
MRREAREIFLQAVKAAEPRQALFSKVKLKDERLWVGARSYSLPAFRRIFVLGAGKAAAAMAAGMESILGPRLTGGLINVKYEAGKRLRRVKVQEAGHPLPDGNGVRGAERMAQLLSGLGENDLVIFLLSGGASALLPAPRPGISLKDKQAVTDLLLRCGATIQEVNTIRKHLSLLKGGGLARLAFPATVITLILSDVIGDPLETIASGPTAPDPTTFRDVAAIMDKYKLWRKSPPAVARLFRRGERGKEAETLKEGDPVFQKVYNLIIGNNLLALKAAGKRARAFGYRTLLLSSRMAGETREVARVHGTIAQEVRISGNPIRPPACLLSGGETTVTVKGKGRGGRNQEFTLAAALEIAGWRGIVVLSGGTDGIDGPTDAAGAIADGETGRRAAARGLDPQAFLEENDSYSFFQRLNGLLMTGPTGTNVMDVRLVLVGDSPKAQSRKKKK